MSLASSDIARAKQDIESRYGAWTSFNIDLGGGLLSTDPDAPPASADQFISTAADVAGKPVDQLRVLDLACLEGFYAIEFARKGAKVLGIEGREANVERARFAKRALGLDNLEFVQDDVRNLSAGKYGTFDIILCLGLLYHLDAPDVFEFVEKIYGACDRLALFHTRIAAGPVETRAYKGRTYSGWVFSEHPPESSMEERTKNVWASLDNPARKHDN